MSAFYSLAFDFCTVTHDSLWHTFRVHSDTPDLNRVNSSPRHFSVFPPTGAEGPRLHLRVGLRQRRAQQGPLLLRRLHQLHLHHLHLQHGRERTQAVVPGGVLVHADHHLQQRGELWPQDCEYGRVCGGFWCSGWCAHILRLEQNRVVGGLRPKYCF